MRVDKFLLIIATSVLATSVAAQTPPVTQSEAAPAPAQAAPPPAPAAPAAAPVSAKTLPTSGDAAQFLSALDRVCVPLLSGAKSADVIAAAGLRKGRDDALYLPLEGGKRINVTPPSYNNPTICTLDVVYDAGGDDAVFNALDAWASLRPTVLTPLRAREQSQMDNELHIISSWSGAGPKGAEGLLLIQRKRADGGPLNGGRNPAQITYSLTPN
jgi:hypothetical protein